MYTTLWITGGFFHYRFIIYYEQQGWQWTPLPYPPTNWTTRLFFTHSHICFLSIVQVRLVSYPSSLLPCFAELTSTCTIWQDQKPFKVNIANINLFMMLQTPFIHNSKCCIPYIWQLELIPIILSIWLPDRWSSGSQCEYTIYYGCDSLWKTMMKGWPCIGGLHWSLIRYRKHSSCCDIVMPMCSIKCVVACVVVMTHKRYSYAPSLTISLIKHRGSLCGGCCEYEIGKTANTGNAEWPLSF